MDIHMYRLLIFITAIIGGASSHYEETYNGHIFILPIDKKLQSPLKLALPKAKDWCTKNFRESTLPRIIEDRDSIFHFIQSAVSTERLMNLKTVLVNGIQHTLGNWSWINGHDVKDIEVKPVSGDDKVKSYNYGYLWTKGDYFIQASRPTDPRNYICEFANLTTCTSDMIMNHKCYRKRSARVTWFEARDRCLTENGDLASFETVRGATLNASLQNLFPDARDDYWIGIFRNLLHLDDKGSEIKFINLTDGHRSDINDKCLCLGVSTVLRWIECNCEDSYPFICTRRETNDSLTSAATIKTTISYPLTPSVNLPSTHSVIVSTSIDQPSTTTTIVSSPMIPITAALSTMISSNDHSPSPNNASTVIGAVVPCVIIVVIIIIVIVVIILRKHRNRPVNSSRYVTSEANMTTTANEFPVYSPVQKPRENQSTTNGSASNTVYATIEPGANANEESQPNSMVYAELDLLPPRA